MAKKIKKTHILIENPELMHLSGVYVVLCEKTKTFFVGRAITARFSEHVAYAKSHFKLGSVVKFRPVAVRSFTSPLAFNAHKQGAIAALEAAGFVKLNRDHWSDHL